MKKKDKAKNNNKKFIITEFILGIIVIVCLIALCVAINNKKNSQIDFGQNITSADGGDFKPNYDAEHESNFSFRLADMECNDDCSNVSKVKIGDKELKLGEDYEVKRGSVIIIIYKKVMQALQTGKADITVDIEKDGKIVTVGVQITITNNKTQEEQSTEESQENQPVATETENNNNNNDQNTSAPTPTPAPTQPEKPKTCSDLHNCDYNLNNHYVIRVYTVNYYQKTDKCNYTTCTSEKDENGNYYHDSLPVAETRRFVDIRIFNGSGCGADGTNYGSYIAGPTTDELLRVLGGPHGSTVIDGLSQADNYATSHNYAIWPWGAAGCQTTTWTWEGALKSGFALDEAKCATWGLSCGRW